MDTFYKTMVDLERMNENASKFLEVLYNAGSEADATDDIINILGKYNFIEGNKIGYKGNNYFIDKTMLYKELIQEFDDLESFNGFISDQEINELDADEFETLLQQIVNAPSTYLDSYASNVMEAFLNDY